MTHSPQEATPDPRSAYEERARRFDEEAAEKARAVWLYGWSRLVVFFGILGVLWATMAAGWGRLGWLAIGGLVAAFAGLVSRHRRARRRLRRVELMAEFNREGVARVERRWADLPSVPVLEVPPDHDYARDLDLTGDVSLLRLVGTCGTAPGWKTLHAWLLAGADPALLARRQEAVRELAGALDFRDALAAETRLHEGDPAHEIERFLRWAEGGPWLRGRRMLVALAHVLPPLNVGALALYSMGRLPTPAVTWLLLISTVVVAASARAIHRVFNEADDGESGVRGYEPILGHLSRADLESTYAREIRARLDTGDRSADREVGTLRRWLDMADVRRSPLFHIPLAIILLWDVHVLRGLERWQSRAGRHVRDWLRAVGECEALAALGALTFDHPGWAFPELDDGLDRLEAEELGHPLLPMDVCVSNDVTVGPPGSFLLVTGSNMSGKSTLLRAVGLNAVLSRAGGPTCARRLRLPPLRVVTSMRVDDSLAGGVSFFMAELHRLRQVVDVAEAGTGVAVLYLLDEILQGTNSAERRVAARAVVRRLVESGAIGAVTTHDLTLADAPDLNACAVPVHFTEMVGDRTNALEFDYQLKPGIATSTNALRLLSLVGLGESPREHGNDPD